MQIYTYISFRDCAPCRMNDINKCTEQTVVSVWSFCINTMLLWWKFRPFNFQPNCFIVQTTLLIIFLSPLYFAFQFLCLFSVPGFGIVLIELQWHQTFVHESTNFKCFANWKKSSMSFGLVPGLWWRKRVLLFHYLWKRSEVVLE